MVLVRLEGSLFKWRHYMKFSQTSNVGNGQTGLFATVYDNWHLLEEKF